MTRLKPKLEKKIRDKINQSSEWTYERVLLTEIDALRGLLEECEKALEWEDRRCGKVFGPLGDALAKLRASRGES